MSQPPISFRRARAGRGKMICLAARVDPLAAKQDAYYPLTRIVQHSLSEPDRWYVRDVGQFVTSICEYRRPDRDSRFFVSVSAEGEVLFQTDPERVEQIPLSGINNDQPEHRGRMFGIRQIGSTLYACGESGQIYRKLPDGEWSVLDKTMLVDVHAAVQDIGTPGTWDFSPNPKLNQYFTDARRASFHTVNGVSEQEVYASGYEGGLAVWDGTRCRWVEGLPKTNLFGIHVDEDGLVTVCGSESTLLQGNLRRGFRNQVLAGDLSLNTVTRFGDILYLTANGGFGGPTGLFKFAGGRFEAVKTGLDPELSDVHTVDSADGILWVVGFKDIVCFDGSAWRRIVYPDNAASP